MASLDDFLESESDNPLDIIGRLLGRANTSAEASINSLFPSNGPATMLSNSSLGFRGHTTPTAPPQSESFDALKDALLGGLSSNANESTWTDDDRATTGRARHVDKLQEIRDLVNQKGPVSPYFQVGPGDDLSGLNQDKGSFSSVHYKPAKTKEIDELETAAGIKQRDEDSKAYTSYQENLIKRSDKYREMLAQTKGEIKPEDEDWIAEQAHNDALSLLDPVQRNRVQIQLSGSQPRASQGAPQQSASAPQAQSSGGMDTSKLLEYGVPAVAALLLGRKAYKSGALGKLGKLGAKAEKAVVNETKDFAMGESGKAAKAFSGAEERGFRRATKEGVAASGGAGAPRGEQLRIEGPTETPKSGREKFADMLRDKREGPSTRGRGLPNDREGQRRLEGPQKTATEKFADILRGEQATGGRGLPNDRAGQRSISSNQGTTQGAPYGGEGMSAREQLAAIAEDLKNARSAEELRAIVANARRLFGLDKLERGALSGPASRRALTGPPDRIALPKWDKEGVPFGASYGPESQLIRMLIGRR